MAIFQQTSFRARAAAAPAIQAPAPRAAPFTPRQAGGCLAWARACAVALSIAAHLLLLAGGMEAMKPPRFALTSSSQKAGSARVEVKLIARSARPAPPEPKARPAQARRAARPSPRVLAARAPARHAVVVEEPFVPIARAGEPAAPAGTAAAPPATVASSSASTLDLPAASSVREVQNVACDIPQPRYPFAMKRAGVEGTVWIYATIGADGHVTGAEVMQSSGRQELDASARGAILSGHCDPYMENGRGITVAARLPIHFRLK